jgi:hypothetical protein
MLHLPLAALIQVVASNPTPFEWASQHIHLIAWPTIVFFVAKAAWYAAKFFTETKQQVDKTIGQINTMATNHFPHMEKSLINMDKNVTRLVMHQTGDASVVEN